MTGVPNILAVARREVLVRIRTRSFVLGTVLLVLGVVVIAFVPVIVSHFDRTGTTKVAVVTDEPNLALQAKATIERLLNPSGSGAAPDPGVQPDVVVTVEPDLAAARQMAVKGEYAGVLELARSGSGSLVFTYFSNDGAAGRSTATLRLAANAIAVADGLERLGVSAAQAAALFAPADLAIQWPDPLRTDPVKDAADSIGQDMLAFGMTILIFMIVLMYGNWVAMSVVEEKSSRVMEVVLNAATPFQLLAGKVLGVGAVAFLQYAAVIAAGIVSLLLQPAVASQVLGGGAGSLTQGLSPGLLLLFGVYGVLGFLLYAALYAAAGSLVSRQEDVNAVVMPMTLLSTAGYMVGVYGSMGLLDARSPVMTLLSVVPFLSPFMMLGRVASNMAQPWEIILSMALLLGTIAVAIWVAARIYAVGVLLYGQRPGARAIWRLVRKGM